MKGPGHYVSEVDWGLAVEFALEPGRVLAEPDGQVGDALSCGSEFLQNCPGGPVLEDRPGRFGPGQVAGVRPGGMADAGKIAWVGKHSCRLESRLTHPRRFT